MQSTLLKKALYDGMDFKSTNSLDDKRFAVAASLIDCISYAVCINKSGKPAITWQAGSLQGIPTPPLLLHIYSNGSAPKIAEQDVVNLDAHWQRLVSGNQSTQEFQLEYSEGLTCRVRDTAKPMLDSNNNVIEIIGSSQYISPLHNASAPSVDEGLIMQSYKQSDFGIAFWDSEDLLLACNLKFKDFLIPITNHIVPGLSYENFIKLAASSAEIFSGSDPSTWINERNLTHSKGGSSDIILPDGRCFEMSERSINTLGTVTIINDISAKLRGEQALRKAKELAEEANSNKSRFLRTANHELRQPLATLKILIYTCINEEDEVHRKDLLHAMDISASIMEDILGVLLQIGQLDAGKITPRITNFQLAPLLERIQIQFQHQAYEKGLDFRIVSSKATIVSDSALLERIISNFVANAIRYTDIGKILIGVRRKGKFIQLEIHDTGCGISEEHINAIFDEYYQVPGGANNRKKGLGLGLNISQRIAKLLDHSIHVKSRIGKGTVFIIDLLIGDVRKSEIGVPDITEAIGGQFAGMKVIIIEDDEILRNTLAELFYRWGADIRQTANESEVNSILETENWIPDLVLADYRLRAGVIGTVVVNKLRKKVGADIPCIVMTADTEPEIIEQIKSQNFPILIKPISPPKLRLMMHNLLFEPEILEEIKS